MTDPAQSRTRRAGLLTPLGVVSLFLSLTEVALGAAVTQTTGLVQAALTAFVILFPIGVAAAFFTILWKRNYVFYAPHEFGGVSDVDTYVRAMSAASDSEPVVEIVADNVSSALSSESTKLEISRLIASHPDEDHQESLADVMKAISSKAAQSVRQSFVRIDTRPLLGDKGARFDLPYDREQPAYRFLDKVYFKLSPHVEPYRYPMDWVLRDPETGRTFKEMGRVWAMGGGLRDDDRPIGAIGIKPGQILEVVAA